MINKRIYITLLKLILLLVSFMKINTIINNKPVNLKKTEKLMGLEIFEDL
jgi:hypothetical protein